MNNIIEEIIESVEIGTIVFGIVFGIIIAIFTLPILLHLAIIGFIFKKLFDPQSWI